MILSHEAMDRFSDGVLEKRTAPKSAPSASRSFQLSAGGAPANHNKIVPVPAAPGFSK